MDDAQNPRTGAEILLDAEYGCPPKWISDIGTADGPAQAFRSLMGIVDKKMEKCPWSKVQHPLEIVQCCKNEADEFSVEARNAIQHKLDSNDAEERNTLEDLEEELGDLIFSTLLLARICEREYGSGTVSLEGALRKAADKVGHRCPYIFDKRYETNSCARASELWNLVKGEQARQKQERRNQK